MEAELPTNALFPAINASLNALSFLFLSIGYILIKKKKKLAHSRAMLVALSFSAIFLTCYLYYHFNYSSGKFLAQGLIRPIYFTMLISHIILAVAVLPFIFKILWDAYKQNFESHKKYARWVFPIWMYISVTGVLVYFFLYQWFGGA